MDTFGLVTTIIIITIIFGVLIAYYIHTLSEDKINAAIRKQHEEDQRIIAKYKLTTYEQEKQKNELLKKEYETLRLIKENEELQEKINKMKYGNGDTTVTDTNNDSVDTANA